MTLARPNPRLEALALSHLTFSSACQMREVYISDDADYERAAKRVCEVSGIEPAEHLGPMTDNVRIVCSHGTDRTLCPPHLVADYFEGMGRGDQFPPLEVVKEVHKPSNNMPNPGLTYYVFGGFTRAAAGLLWELETMPCLVYDGTRADAEFYALSENRTHGARTGFGDKSKAVLALIASADGMARCRREAERGGGLALAMANACLVSSALVTAVLRKQGQRVSGLQLLTLEEKKPEVAEAIKPAIVVVPSRAEPDPPPPPEFKPDSEGLYCTTPQVTVRGSTDSDATTEPVPTSEDAQTESSTVPSEVAEDGSAAKMAGDAELPLLLPHRYAALMAGLVKMAKEFTKAIRDEGADGARLREALGVCKLLDFVPERVDKQTGEVVPAHVDFIIFRGLVRVLDLAGASGAKPARIKHAYDLASGGFVPPAHVRRQKVKGPKKGNGGK